MSILTRKILCELLRNFLSVLLVLLVFFLLGNIVRLAHKMPDAGAGIILLGGRMIWVLLPYSLSIAWAPACLASGLVTFSKMSSVGELEAAACSGLSRCSLMMPVIPLAFLVSTGGYLLHTQARPWARNEKNRLFGLAEVQLLPLMAEQDQRRLTELVPGLRIDLSTVSRDRFFAPRIWRLRNGQPDIVTAKSGAFELDRIKGEVRLVLNEGIMTIGESKLPSTDPFESVAFEEFSMIARLGKDWEERLLTATSPKNLTVEQLQREIRSLESEPSVDNQEREQRELLGYRFVLHNKYALGINGGLFLILGACLGFVTDRHRVRPAMFQVPLVFVTYYGLMLWCELGVRTYGAAAPYMVWVPNGLFVVCTALIFFCRK